MKLILTFSTLLFFLACANKPCRDPQTEAGKPPLETSPNVVPSPSPNEQKPMRVSISKPDGSKQCKGSGISEATMQKELKGITVYSAKKDHDGLMRIQVCGADTGRFNVYEIDSKDLDKAKALGFSEWKK